LRSLAQSFAATLQRYDCRYGAMFALPSDNVIGKSLRIYGEWAEHELSILRPFISGGATVVDVGANIGTHTLPFSRWVETGSVVAIEAQPAICDILRLNCRQNGCANVRIVNAICGEGRRYVEFQPDYANDENFGGISFAGARSDTRSAVRRLVDRLRASAVSSIPVVTLDHLCRSQTVSFIKLDVEGMELDALHGSQKLIARCRPVIAFEQNSTARLSETFDYLTSIGYQMFWLETQPFNQNNFRGEPDNIWWRSETGILALPEHRSRPPDLIRVKGDEVTVPVRLNARDGVAVAKHALERSAPWQAQEPSSDTPSDGQ
jgi:FkbM family methyltransferase